MNLYHPTKIHASNLRDGANPKKSILLNRYGIDVPVDKKLATALKRKKWGFVE